MYMPASAWVGACAPHVWLLPPREPVATCTSHVRQVPARAPVATCTPHVLHVPARAPAVACTLHVHQCLHSLSPRAQVVGPIQPRPPQPLPPDLQGFFDGAGEAGVVYVSLGTYDGLGDGELLTAMATALRALPCRVLWKLGSADFDLIRRHTGRDPELGPNIRTIPFAPQNDILGHPATRVFLSHLGLNSLYEAAYHGVPIVGLPLASDQPDNMKVAEHHGFGFEVPHRRRSLPTHEDIQAALLHVLKEPSFRHAAARMSALLHGHRRAPLQVAAGDLPFQKFLFTVSALTGFHH